jgi:S-formylglutathione hydrolase FrmB
MRHKDMFAAAVSHSGVDALLYKGPDPYAAGKVEMFDKVIPVPDPMIMWLTGIFGNDIANWRAHDPASLAADLKPGELAIYLDCGTEDMFHLQNGEQYLHDLLTSKHIDHEFFIGPGGHDFAFWGPRMPKSFAFLKAHVSAAM